MTEREKMLSGALYDPTDPELTALREKAHRLSRALLLTPETEGEQVRRLLDELVPRRGPGTDLNTPLFFDYGAFTSFGECCYANVNLTVLDCAPVTIGDHVFFGPNCSLLTPVHPLVPEERRMRRRADGSLYDLEYARPITIEDDCWIAGNVTVCGGVTIGRGSVIGAGSVVTRDIPPGVLAAGNPCHVIRPITDADILMD